jgi:MoxR-like ATPase
MPDLSDNQKEIIELWADLLERNEGNLAESTKENAKRAKRIEEAAEEFVAGTTHTQDEFDQFWDELHSPFGFHDPYSENDTELIVDLIEDMLESEEYDPDWERPTHCGPSTIGELFGQLTADQPIANDRLKQGLNFFGYDVSDVYEEQLEAYNSFKEQYLEIVGDSVFGDDVPPEIEIDKLFFHIDEAENKIEESEGDLQEFYERVLDKDSTTEYYWVNQRRSEEREEGYLRASKENYDRLMSEIQRGDIIFHYSPDESSIVGESTVQKEPDIISREQYSEYDIDEDAGEHYIGHVDLEYYDEPVPLERVCADLDRDTARTDKHYPLNINADLNPGYLFRLSETAAEIIREGRGGPGPSSRPFPVPTFELTEQPDNLYFKDWADIRNQLEASLNSGKNIILNGPPGTGKTKIATWLCEQVTEQNEVIDDYEFTTATADWTAFDTIGGYVPSTDGNQEELEFQPRIFLNRFRNDDGNPKNEWLLIDEINRSDIDKAFGQLFSVLSGDSVTLPYERDDTVELVWAEDEQEFAAIENSPDKFPVTESWRLVATMNTHDKASLYEMSYAFMRRFNFVYVGVPDVTEDLLDPDNEDGNYVTAWIDNEALSEEAVRNNYKELTKIWQAVNAHNEVGPSIIRDIFAYVESYPETQQSQAQQSQALTNAVIALVFPQMEGMRPDDQARLLNSLSDIEILNDEVLTERAEDIFGREFTDDE